MNGAHLDAEKGYADGGVASSGLPKVGSTSNGGKSVVLKASLSKAFKAQGMPVSFKVRPFHPHNLGAVQPAFSGGLARALASTACERHRRPCAVSPGRPLAGAGRLLRGGQQPEQEGEDHHPGLGQRLPEAGGHGGAYGPLRER